MHKVYYMHFFNIICVVFVVKFKKISLSYKIEDVGIGGRLSDVSDSLPHYSVLSPEICFLAKPNVCAFKNRVDSLL